MRSLLLALFVPLLLMSSASAATITMDKGGHGNAAIITISGEIVSGDERQFRELVDQIPRSTDRVVVILNGPGGRFALFASR